MRNRGLRYIRFTSVVCCLLVALSTVPASAQSTSANVPPSNLLEKDPRLDRQVTVDETGISLKGLLRKLSDRKLTLSPEAHFAEQKVQIHLNHRPLRTLMSALAELLSGFWEPISETKGYQFSQSATAQLRRRRWWSLFMGERDQAMAEIRAGFLQYMRGSASPTQYSSTDPATETEAIQRMRAERDTSHDLFAHLPSDLQEQLADRIDNDAYLSNSQVIGGSELIEGSLIAPMPDLPQSTQDAVAAEIAANSTAPPPLFVPTYLCLHNSGIMLQAFYLDTSGQTHGQAQAMIHGTPSSNTALLLDQRQLAIAVLRLGRQTSPTWKELAAFQNSTVWKNDRSVERQGPYRAPPHRSQMLAWLASKGHLDLVADYYSLPFSAWSDEDQHQSLRQPVKTELDCRAAEQDMSWKRNSDNIVLFRNNRWYRDDYLEVPDDLLNKWAKQQEEIDQDNPRVPRGKHRHAVTVLVVVLPASNLG